MRKEDLIWLFFVVGIGLGIVFTHVYQAYPGVQQSNLLPDMANRPKFEVRR